MHGRAKMQLLHLASLLLSLNAFTLTLPSRTPCLDSTTNTKWGQVNCSIQKFQVLQQSQLFLASNGNNGNADSDADADDPSLNFNLQELSDRIQQIQSAEVEASEKFTAGISQRVKELESSQSMEQRFDQLMNLPLESSGSASSITPLKLPVICFDALLPGQMLEGSTEDVTFIKFLREVGLGGWFVMTSLNYRARKLRRNGVICKIECIDVAAAPGKDAESQHNVRIPTSACFVISGRRRCRILGPSSDMKVRIGRWRRIYDDYGEEAVLGWGEERFLDLRSQGEKNSDTGVNASEEGITERSDMEINDDYSDYKQDQWSPAIVNCNPDSGEIVHNATIEKAESLIPLIGEWLALASNVKTYENLNVTATARIQRGQPILSIDPDKLLQRVLKGLGPRPSTKDTTSFIFWVGALINPLPVLGVSLEIRGPLLEAQGVEARLGILERGLVRSIQNLKGERPL